MTPKKYFVPDTDAGKVLYLNNFGLKISTYATALNISPAEVTSHQNDAAMFDYAVKAQEAYKTFKQDVTSYKNFLRDGEQGPPPSEPFPVPPVLPAPPTTVNKGVFKRNGRAVANIKSEPAFTNAMGESLGIIGDEETFNVHTMKPVLKSQLDVGRPLILWTKGHADSLDIYVDRKDGTGFVYLVNDSQPDYLDTFPMPPDKDTVIWDYKAVYKIGDDQVGQFSKTMSVTVTKQV